MVSSLSPNISVAPLLCRCNPTSYSLTPSLTTSLSFPLRPPKSKVFTSSFLAPSSSSKVIATFAASSKDMESPEALRGSDGPKQELKATPKDGVTVAEQRIVIKNNHGEKLVGVLHDTGSSKLVILCHGFRSSKESRTIAKLADALTAEGIAIFRFDFSGNGESEGSFQFGNYWKEVDDLRSVISYFSEQKRQVASVVGHSKGGNVVLLYASKYHDISAVVNVSGRFNLRGGLENRLGNDFLQRIKRDGFIDLEDKNGPYRVTEESLMDRLKTDMHGACLSIDKNCSVSTVHGSADEIIPVEDALEIAKLIPNHKLHIIEGADHGYTMHHGELGSTLLDFLRTGQVEGASTLK